MFDKKEYWKSRDENKRGQGLVVKPKFISSDETRIDNEGDVYSSNRAKRRQKPPTDKQYTKSTPKFKKLRKKNERTDQQRKRDAARARKARKESNSEIS